MFVANTGPFIEDLGGVPLWYISSQDQSFLHLPAYG